MTDCRAALLQPSQVSRIGCRGQISGWIAIVSDQIGVLPFLDLNMPVGKGNAAGVVMIGRGLVNPGGRSGITNKPAVIDAVRIFINEAKQGGSADLVDIRLF